MGPLGQETVGGTEEHPLGSYAYENRRIYGPRTQP